MKRRQEQETEENERSWKGRGERERVVMKGEKREAVEGREGWLGERNVKSEGGSKKRVSRRSRRGSREVGSPGHEERKVD